MQTFRPIEPPSCFDAQQRDFLIRLQTSLQQSAQRANASIENEVLHEEPSKARPGMEVYADGVDWNPGSGEGKYRRDKTNTTWTFIG